ncbi:acyl-CoA thioesterase [Sediminibacterium sp. TEGAF015]|uniref:acyl-CoA thioesterase n=1 Tax=Sediminibacterium sp. TEGAF015 TaxID=575378 RepID=UPI00220EE237|nr:thioesterase family protein [Sediminibacterium sp. TEGAF015]BDQ11300.1 thioesterase [Sediminibacterium sp. TEGAF015]
MYEHITTVRVRYAETDQMNIVYYGNYAQYFEVGRAECIRALGFTYREMEEMGIRMPVVAMESRFLRPARYDDLISIKTILKILPEAHEICFEHEVYNENKKLLTTGKVTLYFINNVTNKRTGMPARLKETLTPYFLPQ